PIARDCRVLWIDAETGKELGKSQGQHKGSVASVCFSPDGKTIASAGQDRSVRLWEVSSGKEVWKTEVADGHNLSLGFADDGKTLWSLQNFFDKGKTATRLVLWEPATGKQRSQAVAPEGTLLGAVAPDGKVVAWAGLSSEIRWWEVATGK